jgi:beta-phosphoglucomutase-like phosphatase (HAD superfamily)
MSLIPTPPYSALIFDCDGTLAHTIPTHIQAWLVTLHPLGVDLSQEWLYDRRGMSSLELVETVNQTFGYALDANIVNSARKKYFLDLLHQVGEIAAVADIARNHYGKIPLAVASGGDLRVVEPTLKAIGLYSLFDAIVTVNDVERGKPAPDIFLLAADRLGIAPRDCIVYEDSDAGLEAAHRAGMRAIDVRELWLAAEELGVRD